MSDSTTSSDPRKKDDQELATAVAELLPGGRLVGMLIKQKRWAWLYALALVLWMFLVYPLVLPLFAALLINRGVLMDAQETYAAVVRKAFRVDEFADQVARGTNQRIDYFQVIEFVGNANESREYALSVVANQKLKYRVEKAQLFSNKKGCSLPKVLTSPNSKLFSLEIQDKEIAKIENPVNVDKSQLTLEEWKIFRAKVQETGRLTFKIVPVQALVNACDGLKVDMRITFEVYKDLLQAEQKSDGHAAS